MGRWDEKLHPRGPGGRFIKKGTGARWAQKISDTVGTNRGEHLVTRGRDRTGDADFAELSKHVRRNETQFDHDQPDHGLAAIYRLQGYHAKPEVLNRQQMDRRIADGWVETWRGFGDTDRAPQYAEQFRSGDEHYPGLGIHGNGTYTATDRDRVRAYGRFQPNPTWDLAEQQRQFDNPESSGWRAIARIAIRPDAKIVDSFEAKIGAVEGAGHPDRNASRVMRDAGRWAALKGYDAIRVRRPGGDFYVILNRSAVAVQEA